MGKGKQVLRIATIISGLLIFALGVARIIKIGDLTFSQALLSFYMMLVINHKIFNIKKNICINNSSDGDRS